jgi:hypothetical protein
MSMDKKQLEDTIGKAVPCHQLICLSYISIFRLICLPYISIVLTGVVAGVVSRTSVFLFFFRICLSYMSHVHPRGSGGSGVADYAPWAWWASCFRYLKCRVGTWEKGWVSGNSRSLYFFVCVRLCVCACVCVRLCVCACVRELVCV